MFEAFRVGVRISLINHASAGLIALSGAFMKAEGDAAKLQRRIEGIKTQALIGGAMLGAGALGLDVFAKALKPAEEYASTLNRLKMAGWSQVDIANAVGDAWKNTHTVITSTVNQNLSTLLDMKNILGTMDAARMALPIVSRLQAVFASSSEGRISGNAKNLSYDATKALDIIGAARNQQSFGSQSEQMGKVILAMQGRVTPGMFKSAFQYARQAKFQLSDEFKYQFLPTLMLENASSSGGGGGSRGVGPQLSAFYRWAIQGYINKKSLPELKSLGLVSAGSALKTTTEGTTVGAMKDANLAAANPFAWAWHDLIPAIYKKYGENISANELMMHINAVSRGNQLSAALMTEFAYKPQNFIRDAANIRKTLSVNAAYNAAISNDPKTAMSALSAQWENFKTAALMSAIPALLPLLTKLTESLNKFAGWARKNQTLVKNLALGFAALSGALMIGGALNLTIAGLRGLGLALKFATLGGPAGITNVATSLLSVGGALKILSGVAIAAAAGFAAGSAIYHGLMQGNKSGDIAGSIMAYAMAPFSKEARDAIRNNHMSGPENHSGDWHPERMSRHLKSGGKRSAGRADDDIDLFGGKMVQVHTTINLDGKKVASVVTKHQANAMNSAQTGTTSTDLSSAPPPIGLNLSPVH